MLENYILLEPNVACEYIIKVNLLENLVKCCHNPKIHEILVSLVDPYLSKFNIFGEIQVKLWEWCYESNFFQRVINFIQNEKLEKMLEEESGTTEEILQKSKQFYSVEKTEMIMKQMVKKFGVFQDFVFGSKPTEKVSSEEQKIAENTINNDSLNVLGVFKNTDWDGEYLKIDELNGKMPDIDNFRGFIENCRKAEIQKNIVLTKRFVLSFHHLFYFDENKRIKKFILNIINLIYNSTQQKDNKKNPQNSVALMVLENLNSSNISKGSQNTTKKPTNIVNLNQSEESILNKSTVDIQMGFTVSKVKGLYPNRLCKELITPLDKVIQKDEYKWQNVMEEEKIAMPASTLLSNIINGVVENEENQKTRDFLKKRKCIGGSSIIDMFFSNGGVCFEKIFLVIEIK